MNSSPNMEIKKIRSALPVAGPRAEKINMRKPDRNRYGVFCLIHTSTPAIIIGMTVPMERILLIISAHFGVSAHETYRTTPAISFGSKMVKNACAAPVAISSAVTILPRWQADRYSAKDCA